MEHSNFDKPLVSVIVPIYNAERYLLNCLLSLKKQTYRNLEIILINDGSTDSSRRICEDFCNDNHNFSLINKDNSGQMESWILGLNCVHGEFLGFVDSDDYIEPNFYELMVGTQLRYNADFVMCSRAILDESTGKKVFQKNSQQLNAFYKEDDMNYVRSLFLPNPSGNLSQARWDKLFRTDLYKQCANIYCKKPVRTFEDRFIVIPYVFYSKSFAFVDEPLYVCRVVKGSSSKKYRPELFDIVDQLYKSHFDLINDFDVYDYFISQIELERLDLLRTVFQRNICSRNKFGVLYNDAKKILSSNNITLVKKHKNELKGRFWFFFKISCLFHSRLMIIIGGKVFRVMYRL